MLFHISGVFRTHNVIVGIFISYYIISYYVSFLII